MFNYCLAMLLFLLLLLPVVQAKATHCDNNSDLPSCSATRTTDYTNPPDLHRYFKKLSMLLDQIPYVGSGDRVTKSNTSQLCLRHIILAFQEAASAMEREEDNWALRMVDATAKVPSGVLDGNYKWLGSFDECLNIRHTVEHDNKSSKINGKYCIVMVPIGVPKQMSRVRPSLLTAPLILAGLCIPNSCTEEDSIELTNTVLSSIPFGNGSLTAVFSMCQEDTEKVHLDRKAIIGISVCSVVAALLFLGTAFDIMYYRHSKSVTSSTRSNTDKTQTQDQDKYTSGTIRNILKSFSVYTNVEKLLNVESPKSSLRCIDGIRFLSMAWVILGHTFSAMPMLAANLSSYRPEMLQRWSFQVILNALLSVDTFFVLSGLLVSYKFMKEVEKYGSLKKINWFMFYFHRFWRLTPVYMMVFLVDITLFQYFGSGPFWPKNGIENDHCQHSWWKNLLYINNFTKPDNQCMLWAWYLACDMQFYVISPLMLIPLYYSKILGGVVCSVLALASLITSAVISVQYQLPASMYDLNSAGETLDAYFGDYYIKPYCRITTYILGIATGYLIYQCTCKVNKVTNIGFWALATLLSCTTLYGLYLPFNGKELNLWEAALYNTLHKPIWGACVCWLIYACATGNGGIINRFLSCSTFTFLSRLTYCAYIVHPLVMATYMSSHRQAVYLTDLTMTYYFIGSLVMSYGAAFLLSIIIELPMANLEKLVFNRK